MSNTYIGESAISIRVQYEDQISDSLDMMKYHRWLHSSDQEQHKQANKYLMVFLWNSDQEQKQVTPTKTKNQTNIWWCSCVVQTKNNAPSTTKKQPTKQTNKQTNKQINTWWCSCAVRTKSPRAIHQTNGDRQGPGLKMKTFLFQSLFFVLLRIRISYKVELLLPVTLARGVPKWFLNTRPA